MAGTATPQNDQPQADVAPNFEELRETMQFDPFGPTSTDEGEGSDEGGQGASAEVDEPSSDEVAPAEPRRARESQTRTAEPPSPDPAPAPEGGAEDKTTEDLRRMVSALLTKEVTGKQEAPQAAPQQPTAQPQQTQNAPMYKVNLPLEIVEGIESEDRDVRHAALNGIVNSIMNRMASDFRVAMQEMYRNIQQNVPRTVHTLTEQQRQVQTVREDFYGNFPELRNMVERVPALDNTIWGMVSQAAQAQGVQQWTPEFRDQVGSYLLASFGVQRQGGRQAAPAPAPQRRAPRTPFAAGTGNPGRSSEGTSSSGNDFLDVLSAGSA